jgi:hypothetical protein
MTQKYTRNAHRSSRGRSLTIVQCRLSVVFAFELPAMFCGHLDVAAAPGGFATAGFRVDREQDR